MATSTSRASMPLLPCSALLVLLLLTASSSSSVGVHATFVVPRSSLAVGAPSSFCSPAAAAGSTSSAAEAGCLRRPTFLPAAAAAASEGQDFPPVDSYTADDDVDVNADVGANDNLPPIPSEWRGEVLSALSSVIDPDLNRDIVTLGFVKNLKLNEDTRTVSFDVELTTPACPVKDQFRDDCHDLVMDLPWTLDADVTMTASPSNVDTDSLGLAQVGAVIAVSSCKGGVGKSTTAVNLAYALQDMGASVGIFDVDVYGPSLPTMVRPDDDAVKFVGRQIAPLQRNGVKLMSFGYVNEGSAVMRGPMVTQLLDQFLSLVNWGQIDYLVLDMPPGTGDIQLTLSQRLNITAAVIVTTPQELSFADVVRGIDMFDSVNVPCVAVVENMAYYEVDDGDGDSNGKILPAALDSDRLRDAIAAKLRDTGIVDGDFGLQVDELADGLVEVVQREQDEFVNAPGADDGDDGNKETTAETTTKKEKEKVRIFGPGHKARLSTQYGIEHTYSVPLLSDIASRGDSGDPFILANPTAPQSDTYRELASAVVREVGKVKFGRDSSRPSIAYDPDRGAIVVDGQDVGPANLRRACRCASCVEELTGRQLLRPESVPESVRPLRMEPCGNYALSVDWSDGHRSLYPYRQIKALMSEEESGTRKEAQVVL